MRTECFPRSHTPILDEDNARQGFVDHGGFLRWAARLPERRCMVSVFDWLAHRSCTDWNIDMLTGKILMLPQELAKTKKGQPIPIRGELLELMERVRANRVPNCAYLFHRDGRQIGDFRKVWQTACVNAGLGSFIEKDKQANVVKKPRKGERKKYKGINPHDFRRTAIRNMVRVGVREKGGDGDESTQNAQRV